MNSIKDLNIGIIDADLIGREKHRFPNLACEKISGYYKKHGAKVKLLTDYNNLDSYDLVYISKVFTDTEFNYEILNSEKIHIGGTGFFFDEAPNLPDKIEHHLPDYSLYNEWIDSQVAKAVVEYERKAKKFDKSKFMIQFKEYTDYSIGFLTRGCFRKCEFCINKKYDHVFIHSSIDEFYDESRKKICLLDDNFLGYPDWKNLLLQLIATGRKFKFKQGLDERILTKEKCELLFNSYYDGEYTFAFDNIKDYSLINDQLSMIRSYTSTTNIKFYVLVGYESVDENDIESAFRRIELLFKYKCLPYVMRYQSKTSAPWKVSKYRSLYVTIARWANQPKIVKKMSFRQFCIANQALIKRSNYTCSSMKSMMEFEKDFPNIAKRYFDLRYDEL